MHVFSQPNPVMKKCEGVCEDTANLCSTLSKLCLWEKKLYHEVKVQMLLFLFFFSQILGVPCKCQMNVDL